MMFIQVDCKKTQAQCEIKGCIRIRTTNIPHKHWGTD